MRQTRRPAQTCGWMPQVWMTVLPSKAVVAEEHAQARKP